MKLKTIFCLLLVSATIFVGCGGDSNIPTSQGVDKTDGIEKVVVEPSWKDSHKLATESKGYTIQIILSVLVLIAAIVLLSQAQKLSDRGVNTAIIMVGVGVLLVGSVALYIGRPSAIHFNNKKVLTKQYYDELMHRDGNINHVWDSLKAENRINSAPMK